MQSANGSERHLASLHGLKPHDLIGLMVSSTESSRDWSKNWHMFFAVIIMVYIVSTVIYVSIGIIEYRIVTSAIWIKRARLSFSKSIEKLTRVCFIQISRETILLLINNIQKNV